MYPITKGKDLLALFTVFSYEVEAGSIQYRNSYFIAAA